MKITYSSGKCTLGTHAELALSSAVEYPEDRRKDQLRLPFDWEYSRMALAEIGRNGNYSDEGTPPGPQSVQLHLVNTL
jgi:hypothetical protein